MLVPYVSQPRYEGHCPPSPNNQSFLSHFECPSSSYTNSYHGKLFTRNDVGLAGNPSEMRNSYPGTMFGTAHCKERRFKTLSAWVVGFSFLLDLFSLLIPYLLTLLPNLPARYLSLYTTSRWQLATLPPSFLVAVSTCTSNNPSLQPHYQSPYMHANNDI
jgi:hypothetical protein